MSEKLLKLHLGCQKKSLVGRETKILDVWMKDVEGRVEASW